MSLFTTTKKLMDEYIFKTNEIYNTTVSISNDVNIFNNGPTQINLETVASALNDVITRIDAIDTSSCDDEETIIDELNSIKDVVESIQRDNTTAQADITVLKDGYNIVENVVSSLSDTIKKWVIQSSQIFGETVKLLEKAKKEGCS